MCAKQARGASPGPFCSSCPLSLRADPPGALFPVCKDTPLYLLCTSSQIQSPPNDYPRTSLLRFLLGESTCPRGTHTCSSVAPNPTSTTFPTSVDRQSHPENRHYPGDLPLAPSPTSRHHPRGFLSLILHSLCHHLRSAPNHSARPNQSRSTRPLVLSSSVPGVELGSRTFILMATNHKG